MNIDQRLHLAIVNICLAVAAFNKARGVNYEHLHGADKTRLSTPAKPKWINVEERVPGLGDSCLVWQDSGLAGQIYQVRHALGGGPGSIWYTPDSMRIHHVTHWMPMPEPPK